MALHGVAETTIFVVPAPPGALQNTIFVDPAPPGRLQTTIFVDPTAPKPNFEKPPASSDLGHRPEASKTLVLSIQRLPEASRTFLLLFQRLLESSGTLFLQFRRLLDPSRTMFLHFHRFLEPSDHIPYAPKGCRTYLGRLQEGSRASPMPSESSRKHPGSHQGQLVFIIFWIRRSMSVPAAREQQIRQTIHPHAHPSIHPSIHASIHPCIHPAIHT